MHSTKAVNRATREYARFLAETATPRDYIDDFEMENGIAINICSRCNLDFQGHISRKTCRKCQKAVDRRSLYR